MLALYIIIGVLGFIALLLLMPVKLSVRYENNELTAKTGLIIRFYTLYPRPEKPKKDKTEEKTGAEPARKKTNPVTAMIEKEGVLGALSKISDVVRIVLQKLKTLLSHVNVSKLHADIKIAADDAAAAAVAYGAACSIVYPVLAAMGNVLHMNRKAAQSVHLYPDFDSTKSAFSFHIKLSVQLIFVIVFLLSSGMVYYKKIINTDNRVKDGAS